MLSDKKSKVHGAFETPKDIANLIIDNIFSTLISQNRLDASNLENFIRDLSSLTFFDPAVGTGIFIVTLIEYISKFCYDRFGENINLQPFLKKFVKNNIYGLELQSSLLEICKKRLTNAFPFLSSSEFENLRLGNTIVEEDAYSLLSHAKASTLQPFSWQKGFNRKFDVVFGNPPYYNIKNNALISREGKILFQYLKHSEKWQRFFRSSGSDIYHFFILKGLEILKEAGILSYIIPSYWIENHHTAFLRKSLLKYNIVSIIDFGDMKLFSREKGKKININSCILTVQKSPSGGSFKVIRVKKWPIESVRRENSKWVENFSIKCRNLNEKKWVLSPYIDIIKEIEKDTRLLKDYALIAQGLSPGVKSVFVFDEITKEREQIEEEVLVPFITNKHIQRWTINGHLWAILPRKVQNIKSYPNTWRYLQKHYSILTRGSDRRRMISQNKIKWYDYSVYRNLEKFLEAEVKIFTPYRAIQCRFALDDKKFFAATDTYAIIPKNPEDVFFLLGILNSKVFNFWYKEAGKKKGPYLEFFSWFLSTVPIPRRPEDDPITPIVLKLLKGENNISDLEKRIDLEACRLYNLSPANVELILNY